MDVKGIMHKANRFAIVEQRNKLWAICFLCFIPQLFFAIWGSTSSTSDIAVTAGLILLFQFFGDSLCSVCFGALKGETKNAKQYEEIIAIKREFNLAIFIMLWGAAMTLLVFIVILVRLA